MPRLPPPIQRKSQDAQASRGVRPERGGKSGEPTELLNLIGEAILRVLVFTCIVNDVSKCIVGDALNEANYSRDRSAKTGRSDPQ